MFLDGTGEIVSRIKDDNAQDSRVAVIEFTNDISNILIPLTFPIFQRNVSHIIDYIKNNVIL